MMKKRTSQTLLALLAVAMLALAFVGYLRPSFMLDVANQALLCN